MGMLTKKQISAYTENSMPSTTLSAYGRILGLLCGNLTCKLESDQLSFIFFVQWLWSDFRQCVCMCHFDIFSSLDLVAFASWFMEIELGVLFDEIVLITRQTICLCAPFSIFSIVWKSRIFWATDFNILHKYWAIDEPYFYVLSFVYYRQQCARLKLMACRPNNIYNKFNEFCCFVKWNRVIK